MDGLKEPRCQYWEYVNNKDKARTCGLILDYEKIMSLPGKQFKNPL